VPCAKPKKIKNKNKFILFLDGTSARDFSPLHEQGTYHIWCSATLVLHLKRYVPVLQGFLGPAHLGLGLLLQAQMPAWQAILPHTGRESRLQD
jgi:hypothetical protein